MAGTWDCSDIHNVILEGGCLGIHFIASNFCSVLTHTAYSFVIGHKGLVHGLVSLSPIKLIFSGVLLGRIWRRNVCLPINIFWHLDRGNWQGLAVFSIDFRRFKNLSGEHASLHIIHIAVIRIWFLIRVEGLLSEHLLA